MIARIQILTDRGTLIDQTDLRLGGQTFLRDYQHLIQIDQGVMLSGWKFESFILKENIIMEPPSV